MNERIFHSIEKYFDEVYAMSMHITENPEISGEEVETSKYVISFLKERGYEITEPYAGMPYSFLAVDAAKANMDLPKVAFMCEYDALPELGHACGHSFSCGISILGALALRDAISDLPVRVDLIGTPGEEFVGGKCYMTENGGFDGYEYAAMVHLNNTDIVKFEVRASNDRYFTFHGKAAHAAGAPEEGLNALNAARLFMDAMDMWRQHIPKDWLFHGIVDNGGTAPNIVPDTVSLDYYYRTLTIEDLHKFNKLSETCAQGAAMAAGCTVEWEQRYPDYAELFSTENVDRILTDLFEEVGRTAEPSPGPGGSSDAGNVDMRIPVFQMLLDVTDRDAGAVIHTPEFEAYLHTDKAVKTLKDGAAIMAGLAEKLALEPTTLARIKKDHAEYRGLELN